MGRVLEALLINTTNNHNKFYYIELYNNTEQNNYLLNTRYGKIGTSGVDNSKTYFYYSDILNEYQTLKSSKLRKGYIEVDIKDIDKYIKNNQIEKERKFTNKLPISRWRNLL